MQLADKYECRDIITAVENFGQLAFEVADVVLEDVALSHFDGEKVVVLFGLPTRGILSEECFSYLFEVVERTGWQRVEPIQGHIFQFGQKS